MRKTVLVVLMAAMIVTPSLAQEVKPEGLFSIEGTLWGMCITFLLPIEQFHISCDSEVGFYQGEIYACFNNSCSPSDGTSSYIDLIVASIAYYYVNPLNFMWSTGGWGLSSAIMQPIGFGMVTMILWIDDSNSDTPPVFAYVTGIMYKIDDNWTPPEIE